ncbi:hypothetical protein [Flavobacterium sp.]|jgi:hypothetical protein|uniref:hypothetical protein n=1 Tax=Flavobacterium sp. TaxID=239 RepID=UPI0025B86FE5|nr:hypothetical protein [Flavobacterium sp.]MBA4153985.1 hypothetical protein [Flavobacterium sp.]
MKTYNTPAATSGIAFICTLIGHKYQTTRKITNHFSEYECKCCGKQMTDDSRGRLTLLTPELHEINETLKMIFHKKRQHLQSA